MLLGANLSEEEKMEELFDDIADDDYAKWTPDDGELSDDDLGSTSLENPPYFQTSKS